MLNKIVIIGPESTGKSTLCEQLAAHFNTSWCPEFARKYLTEHGTDYSYDNLLTIAKGQWKLEEQYAAGTKNLLFIDTDQYVMKVWCEFVFNRCHNWILNRIADQQPSLYLLANIDLPWVKDEMREYPNEGPRKELYHIYKDILVNQHIPWVEIRGNYEERLELAISSVTHFLQAKN